ncbi:8763_t:CDS:1 [Funneliformis geosporum]|uniref:8763_t:CDS:1 n=1 Tax=Funneliformis geosporum TaxID=1117311 RepID=A0A9W4WJQ5_9GLOM|nr:8763_t:CDS:1 [Funneliformis geosporum]
MPCQLPADCLNEIFEYLEDFEDKVTLYSCLLVNRLWCEVSVEILWKSIWNCRTLIACLPIESKEILLKNEIIISPPTSKPPLFNYITFIKVLQINKIGEEINNVFEDDPPALTRVVVAQEIFKMFMNKISLKKLNFYSSASYIKYIPFTSYPGAIDCLKNLAELNCNSNIHSVFFHQLSKICHNIQSLNIGLLKFISNGVTDLISVQRNLKYLSIIKSRCEDLTDMIIIPSIAGLPNTLIKLSLYGDECGIPLSFIAHFSNLQELILAFDDCNYLGFEKLRGVIFPKLHILKFKYGLPKHEYLTKFLENNGVNLERLELKYCNVNHSLNLAIVKSCPNLKSLGTIFSDNELGPLKVILNHCKQLESIRVECYDDCFNERELLEMVAKYSPKGFHELKLYYGYGAHSELFPKELDSFFTSLANRIPQKSLSFIIINGYKTKSLVFKEGNMEVIEKYIKLGVIKKFESTIK